MINKRTYMMLLVVIISLVALFSCSPEIPPKEETIQTWFNDYSSGECPTLPDGLGLNLKKIVFDYAYVPYADLGNSHRISIAKRW